MSSVLGRTYDSQTCSIARALEIVGERWTLLILRDAVLAGLSRFSDFQRSLGIAPNVLQQRLEDLVVAGLLERRIYSRRPELAEYLVTERGRDLTTTLLALSDWGDRWAAPAGPAMHYRHGGCGGALSATVACTTCGALDDEVRVEGKIAPGMGEDRIRLMSEIFASRARDGRLSAEV